MPSALRLDDRFRWGLYGVFSVLFVTGVIWLLADALKESPSGDFWQGISASLLMIHGGAAMVTLVLLGALIPVHVLRGWRSQRNRLAGAAMVIANVLFVATAFGLYYAGSDTWRPWISDVHIAIGVVFPALIVIHVWTGRRSRPSGEKIAALGRTVIPFLRLASWRLRAAAEFVGKAGAEIADRRSGAPISNVGRDVCKARSPQIRVSIFDPPKN